MRLNVPPAYPVITTHEGALARRIPPLAELRRTVCACLLWEDGFYESGVSAADRIRDLVTKCKREDVAALAIEARSSMNLRHVPLLLVRELARVSDGTSLVKDTLEAVIQRPDEIMEFLSIYWKDGRTPIARQVLRGLERTYAKFNEYRFAKYNRDTAIKLRDVMFLTHPNPRKACRLDDVLTAEREALHKRIADNELKTPDTWEVALSTGQNKKETFERLITEKKLGYMALLRNLRNMEEVSCDRALVSEALIAGAPFSRALPFRFIAAARAVPRYEQFLDQAMQLAANNLPTLEGGTVLLIDVSGSMDDKLSTKSDMTRLDAACGLAILVRELCNDVAVYTFSNNMVEVPARRGMALRDAIAKSQQHGGTNLGAAVKVLTGFQTQARLIVITDEQSHDSVPNPPGRGYMINVASYQHGVGYGPWVHVDGFSESVLSFVVEYEKEHNAENGGGKVLR